MDILERIKSLDLKGNIIQLDYLSAAFDMTLDLVERFPEKAGKKEDYKFDKDHLFISYLKDGASDNLDRNFVYGLASYIKAYSSSKDDMKFWTLLTDCYYYFGEFYRRNDKFDTALAVLNVSLEIKRILEKMPYTHKIGIGISKSYLAVGYVYMQIGDYKKALEYFENDRIQCEKCLERSESYGMTMEALSYLTYCYDALRDVYEELGDIEKANECKKLADEFMEKTM